MSIADDMYDMVKRIATLTAENERLMRERDEARVTLTDQAEEYQSVVKSMIQMIEAQGWSSMWSECPSELVMTAIHHYEDAITERNEAQVYRAELPRAEYECPFCHHPVASNEVYRCYDCDERFHKDCLKSHCEASRRKTDDKIADMTAVVEAAYPFIRDAGIHWEDDEGMTRQYCGYCCAHSEWFPVVDSESATDINGNLPMAHAEICIAENARKLFNALNVDDEAAEKAEATGNGMSEVFGRWPGTETEEELLNALKAQEV